MKTGFRAISRQSALEMLRRPIYWFAMLFVPLFSFLFLTSLMSTGLPSQVPAAIVDRDGSGLSREISQNLGGMQMVNVVSMPESFTEARHQMQEGSIFGFFLIPENYQADLLAGRAPVITFYTNMTFYVPATMLFKTFKSTALFAKAGIAVEILDATGATSLGISPEAMMMPVNITARPIGNPWLNYAIYLCNSFIPCVVQLMIMLVTCFSLGEEIKYGRSPQLLGMARGSVLRAVTARLAPQTMVWFVVVVFMEAWLFRFNHFPMHGSWFWLTLSELMFVLASQGFALFVFGCLPNLRLSLSVCALTGILSFSIAAFSFPAESMYGAVGIFSWLMPIRYNFLIYIDQALNGIHVYYSRVWFVAYIIYMLLPLTMMWRMKRAMARPVYVP